VPIQRIDEGVPVCRLLPPELLIEHRIDRRSGYVPAPGAICTGHVQSLERQAAVELPDAFAIEPVGDAIVAFRRVEGWKIEPADTVTPRKRS
jgi:hypothetical protein